MKVKCFGCDASIEADGADEVVDAFVAHGRERQPGRIPRRRSETTPATTPRRASDSPGTQNDCRDRRVTVHPVSEDRVGDWLRFFDHEPLPATPIGPRAIASNPTYRRRPSNLSAHGARRGRPWPSDFGAAGPSDISRTSTADPRAGSTPHCAPTTASTALSIPTDPSRHP